MRNRCESFCNLIDAERFQLPEVYGFNPQALFSFSREPGNEVKSAPSWLL